MVILHSLSKQTIPVRLREIGVKKAQQLLHTAAGVTLYLNTDEQVHGMFYPVFLYKHFLSDTETGRVVCKGF